MQFYLSKMHTRRIYKEIWQQRAVGEGRSKTIPIYYIFTISVSVC